MLSLRAGVRGFLASTMSVVLVVFVSVLAGQASCLAEGSVQADPTKLSASMPSVTQGLSSGAADQVTPAQHYVELYEGGSFVGDRPVTRKQLLDILDRIIKDIADGKIFIESSDAELLREFADQREQIVALNSEMDVLKTEVHELNKRLIVLTEQNLQIAEQVNDAIAQLEAFAEELKRYVLDQAALNSEVLNAAIEDMNNSISRLKDEAKALRDEIGRLEERINNNLKLESQTLNARMSNLRTEALDAVKQLSARVESLESDTTYQALRETIEAQQQRISELEHRLAVVQSRYDADLKVLSDNLLKLNARLIALERSLSDLSDSDSTK